MDEMEELLNIAQDYLGEDDPMTILLKERQERHEAYRRLKEKASMATTFIIGSKSNNK